MNIFKQILSSVTSLFKKKSIKPVVLKKSVRNERFEFVKPKTFKTIPDVGLKTENRNVQSRLEKNITGAKSQGVNAARESQEILGEKRAKEGLRAFAKRKEKVEDISAEIDINKTLSSLTKAIKSDYAEFKAERDARAREMAYLLGDETDEDKQYRLYGENVEKNRIREEKREKRHQIIQRIMREKDPGYKANQDLLSYIEDNPEDAESPLMSNEDLQKFYEGAEQNLQLSFSQVRDPFEAGDDMSGVQALSDEELEEIRKRKELEDREDEDPYYDPDTLEDILEEMAENERKGDEEDELREGQEGIIDSEEDQGEGETN